jgi:hypothetical protein
MGKLTRSSNFPAAALGGSREAGRIFLPHKQTIPYWLDGNREYLRVRLWQGKQC